MLWFIIAITIRYVGTDTIIIEITGIPINMSIISTILGTFIILALYLILVIISSNEILFNNTKTKNIDNNTFNIIFSYIQCTNKVLNKKDKVNNIVIIQLISRILSFDTLFIRFLINLIIILILIVNNIKHIFGPVTVMMIYI